MYRVTIFVLSAMALVGVATTVESAQVKVPSPVFHLTGDEVTLPITLAKGIPFINAEVNGAKGRLMLDTGAASALSLNNRRVPLKGGTAAGTGMFGKGETFTVLQHERVGPVRVGNLTFVSVTNVRSQAAEQLEHIAPDFLGWLGFGFFDGYAVKFDYDARKVTFYKDGPNARLHFLQGETVVAAIPFETRRLPNIPITSATLGSVRVDLIFDTGQYGMLFGPQESLDRLIAEGRVTPGGEDERMKLSGLVIGNDAVSLDLDVYTLTPTFPPAKAIGTQTTSVISLGYAILSRYKTVWDYGNKTLYLLKPRDRSA